jgi:flagellar motor switch/type III secretory pathway protein FliN
MAMAAEASPTQVVERPPGQLASETAPSAPNPELRAGRESQGRESEEDGRWKRVLGLPCELAVDLPVPGFKIADLLELRAGSLINSHWPAERDAPLRLNGTLIGWGEFEVVGNNLAVRLTELA